MSMYPIASVTIGAGGGTPSFTSIPQIYKHLQLRVTIRGTRGGAPSDLSYIRFNGDFGVTYNSHSFSGNGSTTAFSSQNIYGFMFLADSSLPDAGSATNVFGTQIWDILDYSDSNKNKIVKMMYGWESGTAGQAGITAGTWRSTAPITTISNMGVANSLAAQYTRVDLYGITDSPLRGA